MNKKLPKNPVICGSVHPAEYAAFNHFRGELTPSAGLQKLIYQCFLGSNLSIYQEACRVYEAKQLVAQTQTTQSEA